MKKKFDIFFIVLATLVFIIALVRSFTMDITIDEAITYIYYIGNKWTIYGITANNHLLNTILALFFNFITQSHYNVFVIRIPNLMFYLLYIFYTYKISALYKNRSVVATVFLLNYSINEFASLSRGYGIASAFILGGIYYYKLFLRDKSDKNIKISLIHFILASLANTICLIPTACFLLDTIVRLGKQKELSKMILNNKSYFIIMFLITLSLIFYHLFVSFSDKFLSYATCNEKVITCLIYSPIINYGLYNNITNILLLICVMIYLFSFNLKDIKIEKDNLFYIILLIFLILIICKIIFPFDLPSIRTIIPIMSIYIISVFDSLKSLDIKINLKYFNIMIIFCFVTIFFKNVDTKYVRMWHPKNDIKQLVEKRYKERKTLSFDEINQKYEKMLFVYYYEKYDYLYGYKLMNNKEYNKLKHSFNKKVKYNSKKI